MNYAVIFDIDGVIRDVSQSYRRALADTVEEYTGRILPQAWRPSPYDIDDLKREGLWNNDWEGSREFVYRAWETNGGDRNALNINYEELVDFFQSRYRGKGSNPEEWDGYINDEPLLVPPEYFHSLTKGGIHWGFFSGATRGSAHYILTQRLHLSDPILHAMEDGPEKPDPTGMFAVLKQLENVAKSPIQNIAYCGDTSSDMAALAAAREQDPQRQWRAIGIIPPHLWDASERQTDFAQMLKDKGADAVFPRLTALTDSELTTLFE